MSLLSRFRASRPRLRPILGVTLTLAAAVLVYVALVVPDTVTRPKYSEYLPVAFLRIPMEAILAGAVLLVLPRRWRRPVAALIGLGIGAIAVLKVANMGFRLVLGRGFNPVLDWPLLSDGYNALTETDGTTTANLAVAGAILLTVALLTLLTLSTVRLAGALARHPGLSRRSLVAGTAAWVALAISGITLFPNAPVASDAAAKLAKTTVKQVPAALRDQAQFAEAARNDPFRATPPADLVAGLKGKDVIIGVVESYGRSVLTDPAMSATLEPTLQAAGRRLTQAGLHARTGWLTSSTYGGGSWLAHASFQSGLWINSQQRYRHLTAGERITLTSTFKGAGYQTVGMEPGNTVHWPEGDFYGYETVYDSRNMGYQGPRFGWSRMPDQYTLAKFQRDVYAKKTRPLMAELTLTSSHEPWTPVPTMIDWDRVGDGAVYRSMTKGATPRGDLWKDPKRTQQEYAKSIAYSVDSLTSWATTYGDKNLVLVMFGDHQPIPLVSGQNASHDIPVTVMAHDPEVLNKIAGWNFSEGLRPATNAPVWRMDEFRDRFFTAFSRQNGVALGRGH